MLQIKELYVSLIVCRRSQSSIKMEGEGGDQEGTLTKADVAMSFALEVRGGNSAAVKAGK